MAASMDTAELEAKTPMSGCMMGPGFEAQSHISEMLVAKVT
jgi:hypothetical protein